MGKKTHLFRAVGVVFALGALGSGCVTPSLGMGSVTSYQPLGSEWQLKHCALEYGDPEAEVLKRCGGPLAELRVNDHVRPAAWCALYRDVGGDRPYAALCFRALEVFDGGGDCMPGDRSPECEAKPTGRYGDSTLTAVFRLTEAPAGAPPTPALEAPPAAP